MQVHLSKGNLGQLKSRVLCKSLHSQHDAWMYFSSIHKLLGPFL